MDYFPGNNYYQAQGEPEHLLRFYTIGIQGLYLLKHDAKQETLTCKMINDDDGLATPTLISDKWEYC
jgi:hypothetical protein